MTKLRLNLITCLLFILMCNKTLLAQEDIKNVELIEVINNNGSASLEKKILIDKDGFLWYSTYNGIVKETGTEHFVYNFTTDNIDPSIIKTSQIIETKDNKIIATTNRGIFILDIQTNTNQFKSLNYPDAITNVHFTNVIEFNDALYFGSYTNFIFKYKDGKFTPIELSEKPLEINHNLKSAVYVYNVGFKILVKQEYLWFVLDEGKLTTIFNELDYGSQRDYNYKPVSNGLIFKKNTSDFYNFKNKKYKYIYLENVGIQMLQHDVKDNIVIKETPNDYNIFGFNYNKFYHYVLKDKILTISKTHTANKPISNFTTDPHLVVYYHTADGIFRLNKQTFSFNKSLNNHNKFGAKKDVSCRSIIEDQNGTIYVYSYNGVFYKTKASKNWKNINTQLKDKITKYDFIRYSGMLFIEQHLLLLYGYNDSLLFVNLETGLITRKMVNISGINYILKTANNNIIAASKNGLYNYNLIQNKFKKLYNFSEPVSYLKYHQGKLYIATSNNGLFIKENNGATLKHYTTKTNPITLINDKVTTLYFDTQDNLWLGTKKGLQKINFKTRTSKSFTRNNGLNNDNIVNIQEDDINMWVATFDGLVKITKASNHIKTFFETDGISENEFNYWSSLKAKDSTIYFGGLNGITSFKNNTNKILNVNHDLFLTSYSFYDPESDAIKRIENLTNKKPVFNIPFNKNYLELKFAINNFSNLKKNFYQYKFDNIHDDWIDLGNYSTIQLAGLQPDTYTLRVRGFTSEGVETPTKTYIIKINEAFYRESWFILLSAIAIGSFLYLVSIYRNKQLKILYKQKQTINQLEAKAMRAQMNPHFIFNTLNSMQSVMILKGEREANKYFSSFSRLVRLTLDMNNAEMTPIKDEVEYLEVYLQLENLRLNNILNYNINVDENLDSTTNKIPSMMLQPVVENAILHGLIPKKNDLQLSINFIDNLSLIKIEICDNGIGRKASTALKNKTQNKHKSWATHILNQRISISNSINKQKIYFDVIDLKDSDNISLGTKVILNIPKHIEPKNKIDFQK